MFLKINVNLEMEIPSEFLEEGNTLKSKFQEEIDNDYPNVRKMILEDMEESDYDRVTINSFEIIE